MLLQISATSQEGLLVMAQKYLVVASVYLCKRPLFITPTRTGPDETTLE